MSPLAQRPMTPDEKLQHLIHSALFIDSVVGAYVASPI
jgi:hypothetical protein